MLTIFRASLEAAQEKKTCIVRLLFHFHTPRTCAFIGTAALTGLLKYDACAKESWRPEVEDIDMRFVNSGEGLSRACTTKEAQLPASR